MKRPELYQRTVDILVDAYFKDTLEHGEPCGCAVGNIVAATCNNLKRTQQESPTGQIFPYDPDWYYSALRKGWGPNKYRIDEGHGNYQIESTGYTIFQINEIEKAFENENTEELDKDEAMFNGLMAVIDVLDIIHENTDTAAIQYTKKRFVKTLTHTP